MEQNVSEFLHRIEVLERRASDFEVTLNEQGEVIQEVIEGETGPQQFDHQNYLLNGDADISRNDYLYLTDVTGTGGVDADVSEELYNWYTSGPDESLESTGDVADESSTLQIDDALFEAGHAGQVIVIEGAGLGGEDLVTTILSFTSSTEVELADSADEPVTGARVRWNLLELVEDSTDDNDDANQATNTTVKSEDHTLYNSTINDPDWDKPNGFFRLGYGNWLCAPLRQNLIRPGNFYINSFIYKLADDIQGETSVPIRIFAGVWDNTPGQQKFLEGAPLALTASVKGSPGATTSTTYFVVMYTNWGESIGTNTITVDAPTVFTNTQFVFLSWAQPAGIVRTEIYRERGGTTVLLNNPYPQSSYQDKGATRRTAASFPTPDRTRMRAYIETTVFNFAPATTLRWRLAQLNIPVPQDYDKSKTTDKQWYIFGILDPITVASDSESESESEADEVIRALLVDKLSLDDKLGTFSRCPWDFDAKRGVSSNPSGGDQGDVPTDGNPIDPGGTGHCPTFDMPVLIEKDGARYEVAAIELVDNEDIYKIVNRQDQAVSYATEVSPEPCTIYKMRVNGGIFTASENEPVFTDEADGYNLLKKIISGDTISTRNGLAKVESNLRQIKKRRTIKITLEGTEKGFWAGGVGIHNVKPEPNQS